MYSALKVNGKKLYELAREGKTRLSVSPPSVFLRDRAYWISSSAGENKRDLK